MNIARILLMLTALGASCKLMHGSSSLKDGPRAGGVSIPQSPFEYNFCQPADPSLPRGHNGNAKLPLDGPGWRFNEKEGCFLDCRDENAARSDFLAQLRAHRVWGDPSVIEREDPASAADARAYIQRQTTRNSGMAPYSFASLTVNDIHDGASWAAQQAAGTVNVQVGDVLLNMNFGQPNHAGIFYTKRGFNHARLVVDVQPDHLLLLDSGWKKFHRATEVSAQTVWLRPKGLTADDRANIQRWSNALVRADFDSALVDDWRDFRNFLNSRLDAGIEPRTAARQSFDFAAAKGVAPGSFESSFHYSPPSGLYCSEGLAAIFSYLGFRQFGETPFDVFSIRNKGDKIPDWEVYRDALSGFNADTDPDLLRMHQAFYSYFQAFDEARAKGLTAVSSDSGLGVLSALRNQIASFQPLFVEGMANPASVRKDPARDLLQSMAAEFGQRAAKDPASASFQSAVTQLIDGMTQVAAGLSARVGRKLTIADSLFLVYASNLIYGPSSFFENSRSFELKGAFYNLHMGGGYQALYISDWWLNHPPEGRFDANIQTTLYRIKNDSSLPADRCVIRERAEVMRNELIPIDGLAPVGP